MSWQEVLTQNLENMTNGTYQQMLNSMYATNSKTANYTQESFYSWRIFGSPYMLLDDPEEDGLLGEWYLNQLRQSQILTLKLGIPRYTGNQRGTSVIDWFNGVAQSVDQGESKTEAIVDGLIGGIVGAATGLTDAKRLYIFFNQYEIYIQYVRLEIITMASYLGILDYPVPTGRGSATEPISSVDWETYTTNGHRSVSVSNIIENGVSTITNKIQQGIKKFENNNIISEEKTLNEDAWNSNAKSLADEYADIAGGSPAIVQFMIQPSYATETFSNTTTKSLLQQKADTYTQAGKEVAWISNTGGNTSFVNQVSSIVDGAANTVQTALDEMNADPVVSMFGSSALGMIRGLTGERMIFPEIFDNSSFEKGASYTINLSSPAGDPYSFFMNIGLPLCYLIPAVAPRTSSANAYRMPFMCQAYVTGQAAIPMGIVSGLSIRRGQSGAMSKDGLPLDVECQISIHDLYSVMAVSSISDPAQFLSNESMIEYIASFTNIDTWNKSIVNEHIVGEIGGAVAQESFDIDKITDRIKYNLGEFAGNKLRIYGIADATR